MFKLSIFLFSLLISISLISQNLQSINPNTGAPGQSLSLTLSGQNTHFNQGSNTIWFSSGSTTAFSMPNPIATSANTINGNVSIPYGTQNGLYNVNAYNSTDGIMTMYNAFNVTSNNAQIITVAPNNGNQGQTLSLSLSCQNANFSSGTNTQVWFSQGSFTMMGTNTTIVNNNFIKTDLYISPTAPTGVYNSLASNSIDGILMKASSFTVNNGSPILTTYPNISKPGKDIDVLVQLYGNIYYSQLYYKKGSIVIPISIQNVMGSGIYGKANIPSSASLGAYSLVAVSSTVTHVITKALTLVAPTKPSIDSAVVDKQQYYRVMDVYGDNTHFTSNNLSVSVDSTQYYNAMDSFVVINDLHLKVYGEFLIMGVKSSYTPIQSWVKIHNYIDDTLTYPFIKYMTSSIDDNLNSFDNIRYFPNPTTDIVRIQCDEFIGNTILVEVYSPDGKFILERKFTNGEPVVINLGAYASGLYNIRVSTRDKTKTLSVIRR